MRTSLREAFYDLQSAVTALIQLESSANQLQALRHLNHTVLFNSDLYGSDNSWVAFVLSISFLALINLPRAT